MSEAKRGRAEHDDQDGNEQAEAEMELIDLPDEMLVEIFSYLPEVEDVLRLRAVCRRWRDLLLHPDVWRHREVADYGGVSALPLLDRVLTLAPCLRRLFITFECFLKYRAALVASTRCAVRRLEFFVCEEQGGIAALVLRNQAALGRLRVVRFVAYASLVTLPSDCRVLLRTLCETEGLTVLDMDEDGRCRGGLEWHNAPAAVDWLSPTLPHLVPDKMVGASLTTFSSASWFPCEVLEYILRCHAATLECVQLNCMRPDFPTPVAALLSEAPHLRELTCSMLRDMALLKKCPRLKELHLKLQDVPNRGALRDAARAFLREAPALEKLTLHLRPNEHTKDTVMDLIVALASSGSSKVTSIDFIYFLTDLGAMPPALIDAFISLPSLRFLDVSVFSTTTDFLAAITPFSVPSLRWLEIRGPSGCAHAWMHSAPVADTLRRNGHLHVRFTFCILNFCSSLEGPACDYCRRQCHRLPQRKEYYSGSLNVFSHSTNGNACSEDHKKGEFWFQLTL